MPLFLLTAWRFVAGSRVAQYALAALAIFAGFALWLHFHDSGVIADHEQGVAQAVSKATDSANATAVAHDMVRASQRAEDSAETKGRINEAVTSNPGAARAPAGPAANAAADSLRHRAGKARHPAR